MLDPGHQYHQCIPKLAFFFFQFVACIFNDFNVFFVCLFVVCLGFVLLFVFPMGKKSNNSFKNLFGRK